MSDYASRFVIKPVANESWVGTEETMRAGSILSVTMATPESCSFSCCSLKAAAEAGAPVDLER